MARWYANKLAPNDKHRNPMQGEFFRNDDRGSEARMLVREGVQNSLDAKSVNHDGPVRLRIFASGREGAARWSDVNWLFDEVWPHYDAEGNGLVKEQVPDEKSRKVCPYLVFEDFGTTGLVGDYKQTDTPDEGADNPFYYFMRAEGESGKSGLARGRWGLGKFVFPKASLVRTFLALTRREGESNDLFVGQFVLKCHKVDGVQYSPDGWFGLKNESEVWVPTSEPSVVQGARKTFNLERRDEPGLSLVVPWCQKQIDHESLVIAVIRDFYFAIMQGHLDIEVASPRSVTRLNRDSFRELFDQYREKLPQDTGCIELALRACDSLGHVAFRFATGEKQRPDLDAYQLDDEKLHEMRELDSAGDILSIRIPIHVERTSSGSEPSYFDVWMQRDVGQAAVRPTFIREGLIIPEVLKRRVRTHHALVLIEDEPLARMLGDAENPAHTNWSFQSENFVGRYRHGKEAISLVRNCVPKIIELIRGENDEQDLQSLADLFRLPRPDSPGRTGKRGGGGKEEEDVDPPDPVPKDCHWSYHKVRGGMVIAGAKRKFKSHIQMSIRLAYDRMKGSPPAGWKPSDFELDRMPVSTAVSGSDVIGDPSISDNSIECVVKGPDFRIEIRGFDERRDLWFDVKETRA